MSDPTPLSGVPCLDLTEAQVFKVTGTAAGTGAAEGDILLHGGLLTYYPAP